jgi:biotin carboxyl carrier protein
MAAAGGAGVSPAVAAPRPAAAAPAAAKPAAAAPAAEAALASGDVPLRAPMPGMIISYSVKVGDKVNTGDLVCILEAMKMQNSLPAPASGTVKAVNFEPGASVAKDAIILVIGK